MRSVLFIAVLACCGTSPHSGPVDGGGGGGSTDGGGGGGGGGTDGGGMDAGSGSSTPTGDLSIIVEPDGLSGSSSDVVQAMRGAQSSIYMTMYELDDSNVIDTLIARKSAGVDVKVLLDGSSSTRSNNSGAYSQLQSGSVPVEYTTPEASGGFFALTHQKTVIIDDKTAWIMSMNLETTSPKDDREYLAVDSAPADVAEATAIFQADYAKTKIVPSGALVVSPSKPTSGAGSGNSEAALAALIGEATSTLDIEVEEMSGSNAVISAIVAAASHVTVHVVVANGEVDAPTVAAIKAAGGTVRTFGATSGNGTATNPYVAGKAIVIDCATASTCKKGYVGSENFSSQSLRYNRELGVIFTDPTQLQKLKQTIDADFAAGTTQ